MHSRRFSLWGKSVGFSLLLFSLVIVGITVVNRQAQADRLLPPTIEMYLPAQAHVGELIRVQVVATNIKNLAGFQGTVRFDPTLRLMGATVEKELSRDGRDLLPMGPVLHPDRVMLGAATCPVEDCYALPTQNPARLVEGVDGDVHLATLEFHAQGAGEYALALEQIELVDPAGKPLSVEMKDAVLIVKK